MGCWAVEAAAAGMGSARVAVVRGAVAAAMRAGRAEAARVGAAVEEGLDRVAVGLVMEAAAWVGRSAAVARARAAVAAAADAAARSRGSRFRSGTCDTLHRGRRHRNRDPSRSGTCWNIRAAAAARAAA